MRAQLLPGYVQSVFDLHLLHRDFVFLSDEYVFQG